MTAVLITLGVRAVILATIAGGLWSLGVTLRDGLPSILRALEGSE